MKTLLVILTSFILVSCGAVNVQVDTTNAKVITPDLNNDGIPDTIEVPSEDVKPVADSEYITYKVIEYTK